MVVKKYQCSTCSLRVKVFQYSLSYFVDYLLEELRLIQTVLLNISAGVQFHKNLMGG